MPHLISKSSVVWWIECLMEILRRPKWDVTSPFGWVLWFLSVQTINNYCLFLWLHAKGQFWIFFRFMFTASSTVMWILKVNILDSMSCTNLPSRCKLILCSLTTHLCNLCSRGNWKTSEIFATSTCCLAIKQNWFFSNRLIKLKICVLTFFVL